MTPASPHPAETARVRVRVPEPALLWIRYAPRDWPEAQLPWLDLASGGLVLPSRGERPPAAGALPELAGGPFDDVVWLPPVPAALVDRRDDLAARLLADGTPVVVQLLPGERPPAPPATVIFDLAPILLTDGEGDLAAVDRLAALPAGAAVVWPLVAGVSDRPEQVASGLDRLAAAGVATVQPAVPRLRPADRRRLADAGGEAAFDRLFHGPDPDERAFARAAAARGLAFLIPRPLPRPPLAGAGNRRLAGGLATAGELWLRLGRAPSQGQAFLRAARWVDETGYDLVALARDGNLGVVEAIDRASRDFIEEAAATGGEPALIGELTVAYLAEEE